MWGEETAYGSFPKISSRRSWSLALICRHVPAFPQNVRPRRTVSSRENDLMFASALLPMLALSDNSQVSKGGHEVIRKLKGRRNDF